MDAATGELINLVTGYAIIAAVISILVIRARRFIISEQRFNRAMDNIQKELDKMHDPTLSSEEFSKVAERTRIMLDRASAEYLNHK